jgi:hypothetical protein
MSNYYLCDLKKNIDNKKKVEQSDRAIMTYSGLGR